MRVKLKKIEQKIWLKDKIERKKASTKLEGIKIEILKNENRNEKPNTWKIAIEELSWKE